MKKAMVIPKTTEMRPEYDFSGGVRGKYAAAYQRGTNVVLLDPDLAEVFPDSKSVNDALRTVVLAGRPTRPLIASVDAPTEYSDGR